MTERANVDTPMPPEETGYSAWPMIFSDGVGGAANLGSVSLPALWLAGK